MSGNESRWTGTPFVRSGNIDLAISTGTMRHAGFRSFVWSSRGNSATNAYDLYVNNAAVDPSGSNYGRYSGYSLRCLNDVRYKLSYYFTFKPCLVLAKLLLYDKIRSMKSSKNAVGRLIVPKNALVQPHELMVGTILSWTRDDVEFLVAGRTHTADIRFRGLEWEIKSPIGKSSRTIENNLRNALKQSSNVIIDLSRIKQPEAKCLREVKRQFNLLHATKRIIVITKNREMIELQKG